MRTLIVEVTNGPQNWGKFMIGWFGEEWLVESQVNPLPHPVLRCVGWGEDRPPFLLLDLQTNEGALFLHGGQAHPDLNKHRIWVCLLYEPFLAWLYAQPFEKVFMLDLPTLLDLPHAPPGMFGHRRPGPQGEGI